MYQHIFLSYSHREPWWMTRMRAALEAQGFGVWTDENFMPGSEEWHAAVEKALKSTFSMVVLLTPESAQSGWVRGQMEFAAKLDIRVFPIFTSLTALRAIPPTMDTSECYSLVETGAASTSEIARLGVALREQLQVVEERRASQPLAPETLSLATRPLSRISLRDYSRLLNWTFFSPRALAHYHESEYMPSVRAAGSWLVNTVCWLPLLVVAVANALGSVPQASAAGFWLILIVLFGWFATGWMGETGDETSTQVVGVIACCIAAAVSFLMLNNSTLAVAFAAAVGIACGIGLGITHAIATETMHGVQIGLAGGALLGAVFPLTASELAAVSAHPYSGFYLIEVFVSSGLFALFVGASLAFTFSEKVSSIMDVNLATGHAGGSSRNLLIILFAAYAVLTWLYLLGGWQYVTPL